jgi:polysaccharide export outer membrane protein
MRPGRSRSRLLAALVALALSQTAPGCHSIDRVGAIPEDRLPRELDKTTLPPYVVEPPDVLLIDVLRVVPQPPYRVEPLDVLLLDVKPTKRDEPITGLYQIEPDGSLKLGRAYGSLRAAGMTLPQIKNAIEAHLRENFGIQEPQASVVLAQTRILQQVRGEHLVRQDGTVSLGTYGDVYVAGMTLPAAKAAIESALSHYLLKPDISLDVGGYNSKVYYIIFDGAGFGQQLYRQPITGNETVLDAIAGVQGLPATSSQKHIWVARPAPAGSACDQVLEVDWCGITRRGDTRTNYQILPGDRIFVQGDGWLMFNNTLTKILTPVERILGVTLLGNGTVRSFGHTGGATGTGIGF